MTTFKTKLRIRIHLKLFKNGELMVNTWRRKRTAIWSLLKANFFDKGHIKVHYLPGVFNDAEFFSKEEGRRILDSFLDTALIKSTEETEWD